MGAEMNPLVIFDTATRLVYCEDVHEVIAAPIGSIVSYDYRRKWIEPGAVSALHPGAPVVLVYCELPGFDRSVDAAFYWGAEPVPEDTSFVITRSAMVDSVKEDGGVFHIALRLDGYISVPPLLLQGLIANLPSRPGRHFVVRATESWDAQWLLRSHARSAWVSVVESIQLPDLQFRKDIFWRVEKIWDRKTGQELRPDVSGVFQVRTGKSVQVLLASHVGRQAASDLAWDARKVKICSVSGSPLLIVKSRAEIATRRTGESVVEVNFPATPEWRRTVEVLSIRTEVDGILGSSANLKFSISYHPCRVAIAVLLATVAAVAAVGAAALFKSQDVGQGVVVAAAGFLAGFVANKLMPLKVS
jgi:hypothetical protein